MENSNEFKKTDFVFIGGRNNNEFYIFPKDENQFKKEAFEDHQLFVHIIHSDGYTEDHLRKINVIWTANVLWNLETMHSKYTKLKLTDTKNLVVYACPRRYKALIVKEFFR